jgi:hypothetical protein
VTLCSQYSDYQKYCICDIKQKFSDVSQERPSSIFAVEEERERAATMLDLIFDPEDGDSMVSRNITKRLPDYTTHSRKQFVCYMKSSLVRHSSV